MDKNIFIILTLILVCSFSVNASFLISQPITEEDTYNAFLSDTGSYQVDMLYEDIWSSYLSGNISESAYNGLSQLSYYGTPLELFVAGEGEEQFIPFYGDLTQSELITLKDILLDNSYIFVGDDTVIDQYILARSQLENKTYSKYLEYESLKTEQRKNINLIWVQIISFTQLIIEILNIGLYLIGFYLFVYVVIEAIPNTLIFMRNKIVSGYLKKRGYK